MTELNFNFQNIDPDFGGGQGFLPVSDEKGWLVVLTGDNGWKPAPKGGFYLELVGKGQDGPVAGHDFALRLNLQHTNVTAQQIAASQLSALGHVLGFPGNIPNTAAMFNKPFRLVSVKQNNNEYTQLANNGIRDINGNVPGGKGPQRSQPAPQQPPHIPGQEQQGQQQDGNWQQGNPSQQWQGGAPQGQQGGFQQQQQQQQPPAGQQGFVTGPAGQPPQQAQQWQGQQWQQQGDMPSWVRTPGQ